MVLSEGRLFGKRKLGYPFGRTSMPGWGNVCTAIDYAAYPKQARSCMCSVVRGAEALRRFEGARDGALS